MNLKKAKALRKAMRLDARVNALTPREYVAWKRGRPLGWVPDIVTGLQEMIRNPDSMRLVPNCQREIYQRLKRKSK